MMDTIWGILKQQNHVSYFCVRTLSSMGRPMSLSPRSKSGSKYSSGVMAVGLVAVAYSRVKSYKIEHSYQISCQVGTKHIILMCLPNACFTPCALMCCSTVPRRDSKMFLSPSNNKSPNFSTIIHTLQDRRVNHGEYFPPTFYPGLFLVCKMLRPCPDHHIYIVHTENLRKQESNVTCRHKCAQQISVVLHW